MLFNKKNLFDKHISRQTIWVGNKVFVPIYWMRFNVSLYIETASWGTILIAYLVNTTTFKPTCQPDLILVLYFPNDEICIWAYSSTKDGFLSKVYYSLGQQIMQHSKFNWELPCRVSHVLFPGVTPCFHQKQHPFLLHLLLCNVHYIPYSLPCSTKKK